MTYKDKTKVVTAGRHPEEYAGAVNPPVYHASTIKINSYKDIGPHRQKRVRYGRHGTPGTHAFEDAMCEIENGVTCRLAPSGLAAITGTLLSFLKTGDHLLMVDNVYEPTRAFCERHLKPLGIEVTYYDPLEGERIAAHFRPNTRMIFTESPGSRTFEVQDIAGITGAARAASDEIVVAMDNTWATPYFFRPLDHGVDVSIQAITKYIGGHSDLMMGTAAANQRAAEQLTTGFALLGLYTAPDDVYLAQRGLRTLAVRLDRHYENALALAAWLDTRDEVARVLYPAWPMDPGHALWKRDFSGASGLFAFNFHHGTEAQLEALFDSLELFVMGFSWGGYESLLVPNRGFTRSASVWQPEGPSFRIHAGLEDIEDLTADLECGLRAFHAAG